MTQRTAMPRDAAIGVVTELSPAMEDYLKTIHLIAQSDVSVTTQVLAEQLSVTPPSVTEMVKRLAGRGLVQHTPYRPITLTGRGENIALDLIERYWLVVDFFITTLGFSDDAVDREANRLEHAVSGQLRACIAEYVARANASVTSGNQKYNAEWSRGMSR